MSRIEEEFQDVLQNIEFALVQPYRKHEIMTDWQTLEAVNALLRLYNAEQRKRPTPTLKLSPLAQESYSAAQQMCELRLGREALETDDGVLAMGESISLSDMIACLKRIRKSIQLWQKEGGRRGYYDYVSQFLL